MSRHTRTRRALAATGAAAMLAVAPLLPVSAHAATTDGPAISVTFPGGSETREVNRPEYRTTAGSGYQVTVDVHNTGTEGVLLRGMTLANAVAADLGCRQYLAPGATTQCTVIRYSASKPAGTRDELPVTVSAVPGAPSPENPDGVPVPGAATISDSATLVEMFQDVVPRIMFESESGGVAEAGTPIYVNLWLNRYPEWDGPTEVVGLRSEVFGDVLDPANPLVHDSTCVATTWPTPCSFWVTAPSDRSLLEDTLTLELSDGTGPRGVQTLSYTVEITGVSTRPTPSTPTAPVSLATWADPATTWPDVSVRGTALTPATRTAAVFGLGACESTVPATLGALLAAPLPYSGDCVNEWRLVRAATVTMLNESVDAAYPAPPVGKVLADTSKLLGKKAGPGTAALAETYESWMPR